MTPSQKINVFVSYSHVDKQWKEEIEKALKESVVAVLLISADFLTSEFINSNELPPRQRKTPLSCP